MSRINSGWGMIAGLGQKVILDTVGLSSAVVAIRGTFTGTLTFRGEGYKESQVSGPRVLFREGQGSLGTNEVRGTGALIEAEYRIVAGGPMIEVEATQWTSGSVRVEIVATSDSSIVFVNGAVRTIDQEAVLVGRSYSAIVPMQTIALVNNLNARFVNPPGTGWNCNISRLVIWGIPLVAGVLEGAVLDTPSALTSPTVITPRNILTGGPASVASVEWKATGGAMTGVGTPQGFVTPSSGPLTIDTGRVVQPGESFGVYVAGLGLTASARNSVQFFWHETPVG